MNRSIRRVGVVLAAAGVATMAGCGPSTPNGVPGVTFQGHTYFLTGQAESWTDAEAEAVSYGGHLAGVGSQAEQDFLTATFCKTVPLWIGASDAAGGGWAWSSGEPLSYTDWSPGEPNNWTGDEHYAAMNWHFAEGNDVRGTWNDAPLDGTRNYAGTTDGPYYGVVELP